jgi:hypothetical protein
MAELMLVQYFPLNDCELTSMRSLTKEELMLIKLFSEKLDKDQKAQLLTDVKKACAEVVTEDGGTIIYFHIDGYQRPEYRGQHVIAEGTIKDFGNIPVTILLHADPNNRLYELEFIRWDEARAQDSKIIKLDWSTLTILDAPLV